jgi:hypothetical protein
MSVHRMKFVVVNNMAPRNPSVCAGCSQLERPWRLMLETGLGHDAVKSIADIQVTSPRRGEVEAGAQRRLRVKASPRSRTRR